MRVPCCFLHLCYINLKKEEGRRIEDLQGLNAFVDLSSAQAGHFLVGSGSPFVTHHFQWAGLLPSRVRPRVPVHKEVKCVRASRW